jgi:uncharacterized protein (TIGR00255 family)
MFAINLISERENTSNSFCPKKTIQGIFSRNLRLSQQVPRLPALQPLGEDLALQFSKKRKLLGMLLSMTGYGKATVDDGTDEAEVEIRTLNSKYLDLSLRTPRVLNAYEHELRRRIGDVLQRGKVQVSISLRPLQSEATAEAAEINLGVVESYLQRLLPLAQPYGVESRDIFAALLRFPEVLAQEEKAPDADQRQWKLVGQALEEAFRQVHAFRRQEGDSLKAALREYNDSLRHERAEIGRLAPERMPRLREALRARLEELLSEGRLDEGRLEQELIYYAEKLDMEEELVRLDNHLRYFEQCLEEGNGKRLQFLSQEMGREINTIGSKANDVEIQHRVVSMKEALEKIKEQVLNVM